MDVQKFKELEQLVDEREYVPEELEETFRRLEEEGKVKNCIIKAEYDTPTEFKELRNNRIRCEYYLGASVKDLAKKFGLSVTTIRRITKGVRQVKK